MSIPKLGSFLIEEYLDLNNSIIGLPLNVEWNYSNLCDFAKTRKNNEKTTSKCVLFFYKFNSLFLFTSDRSKKK